MIKKLLRFYLCILPALGSAQTQYSINYASTSAGALIPTTPPIIDYFGPNAYGGYGACNTGSWSYIHALCSDPGFENYRDSSVKTNTAEGSTWYAGGGELKYMVVDLGVQRTFNELRVFQMNSDGKVTHVRLYNHTEPNTAPTNSDPGWNPLFAEQLVGAGSFTGVYALSPTSITFTPTSSRFVKFEFRNTGILGDASYTEVREVKLFNNSVILSARLLKFSVFKLGNKIELRWQTAQEINHSHYNIQRSVDGKVWSEIGRIYGRNIANQAQQYEYSDLRPLVGKSYYRLKLEDMNGNTTYSEIQSINLDNSYELYTYKDKESKKVRIHYKYYPGTPMIVYNIHGDILHVFSPQDLILNQELELNSSSIQSGLYMVRYGDATSKIIVE